MGGIWIIRLSRGTSQLDCFSLSESLLPYEHINIPSQNPTEKRDRLTDKIIGSPGGVAADADTAAVKEKLWAEIMAVLKGIDPDATLAF